MSLFLLLVHISLEQANVKKATSLVKKELKNMQVGIFTEEELKDAINNNSNLQLSKVVNQGDWRAIMAIKK